MIISFAGGAVGRRGVHGGGGGSAPAYFANATEKTWIELATTLASVNPCPLDNCSYSATEGQDAVIDDWCGAVASNDSLIIAAQGGHAGTAENSLYELDFTAEDPAWVRRIDPSTTVQENVAYYADGKPSPAHGESMQVFIPSGITNGDRWFQPVGYSVYGTGNTGFSEVRSWERGTSAYDPQDTFADFPFSNNNAPTSTAIWDSGSELVWVKEGCESANGGIVSFNPATNTWSARNGAWVLNQNHNTAACDPIRRIFLNYDGTILFALDLNNPTNGPITITATGTAPGGTGPGLVFDPVSNVFLAWNGGATVFKLTPGANWKTDDWAWSTLTNDAANAVTPTIANTNGTYGRFNYISTLRALCVVNNTSQSTYLYKLPEGAV